MTEEGFTVGLIRVGDNVKKHKLLDLRGKDEVKTKTLVQKMSRIASYPLPVGIKSPVRQLYSPTVL